jgi:hypothetical protein
MNTNDIIPKASSRLNRIKIASRVFRYVIWANLIFNVVFWLVFSPTLKNGISLRTVLMTASVLLMFLWFWKLAQLFRLYENGSIFSGQTIHCIKMLGIICVIGWMILLAVRFTPRLDVPVRPTRAGATVVSVQTFHYRVGFLSFDFGTGIDFGLLFVGGTVILIAWIMDEGRKMQEEQELTV